MVSRRSLAVAGVAVGLALSSAAQAQNFLRPLNADGIGRVEWNLMNGSAKKLYHPAVRDEGAVESWTSPSGAEGTVTLERVETRADGSPCVVLLHEVMTPAITQPYVGRSRQCRQPNGTWLIAAE